MRAAALKGLDPNTPTKDSGIDWLGEIPAHWTVMPIRALARRGYRTFTDGDWIESPFIRDEGIRLLQTGNVGIGEFKEQGFRYIDHGTFRAFRCTEVLPGDILICRLADPVGRACLAPDLGCRMITSVDVCILKPASDVAAPFIVYALSSSGYLAWLSGVCRGGTRDRVSRSMLGAIRVQLPPPDEQRAIAAFLDRETARIDALIEKKRRQIELLHEKRAALISHAVTKGLDPSAPMKDSGIDWLGHIPAHWAVIRIGLLCAVGNGSTPSREKPEYWSDESYPWLTSAKINEEIIEAADEAVSELAFRECHLPWVRQESVLLAITGEGQTRGRAALLRCASTISQHLAYITPRNIRLDAPFLWRALQSQYEWLRMESSGTGSTRAALTCEFIRTIKIPLPPPEEQGSIVAYVDRATDKINLLVAKVSLSIDRLREYRTALVSAAVTGKLDVREEGA